MKELQRTAELLKSNKEDAHREVAAAAEGTAALKTGMHDLRNANKRDALEAEQSHRSSPSGPKGSVTV